MTQATEERVTENLEQNIIEKSFSFSSEEAEEKEQLGVVGALDEEEVESSNLKDAFNLKSDVGLTTDDMADSEMEDSPIVPRDGEVDFENFYEGIDFEALLAQYYADWLDKVQDKQFYKVFSQLFELYNAKTLNYLEREFLWKFAKAINSTIMHLLIEAEQHVEATCLLDEYFDSLMECLFTVMHAQGIDDIMSSFKYMITFLKLTEDEAKESEEDEEFSYIGGVDSE